MNFQTKENDRSSKIISRVSNNPEQLYKFILFIVLI